MSNSQVRKGRALGAVLAMIIVAALVMTVVSTGNAVGAGTLPGRSLDMLASSQICGGAEGCAPNGSQCTGTVGDQACPTYTPKDTYGRACNGSPACGSKSCSGPNHYVCDSSGNACSLWSGDNCCSVSVPTCATHGDGSLQNPYSCTCDGSNTDVSVSSRTGCTAGAD